MSLQIDSMFDSGFNPLDAIEEILSREKWHYSRMTRDELLMEVRGNHGVYKMVFMWNSSSELMQFCCQYDVQVLDFHYAQACQMINEINYSLTVGHFHISPESLVPCFRHTQLFRGMELGTGADHLDNLIRIAVEECDFHYPALLMLSDEKTHDDDQLAFALMATQGQS